MIATITVGSTGDLVTAPAGWVMRRRTATGSCSVTTFVKLADANDLNQTNFIFTIADSEVNIGAMIHVADAVSITFDKESASASSLNQHDPDNIFVDDLYLIVAGCDAADSFNPISGVTEHVDAKTGVGTGGVGNNGAAVMMSTTTSSSLVDVARSSSDDFLCVQGFFIRQVYNGAAVKAWGTQNYKTPGTNVSISKPTHLAEGDLLLAQVTGLTNDPNNIQGPSGWSRIMQGTTGGESWVIFGKTADANDADDVISWHWDSTDGEWLAAALIVIGGVVHDFSVKSAQYYPSSGTLTVFNNADLNIPSPNSLVLFFTFMNGGSGDAGGYGMVNDNPPWAELYDFGSSQPATNVAQSLAYAIRPQAGNTGDFFVNKPVSSSITGIFMALTPLLPSNSPSPSPSISRSPSPSASVSPSASRSQSSSISPSLSPSASRSVSVSTSPSASDSPSVSPSPSPGIDAYNTSIITAVKRVQQNLAFPKFVMGGKGGAGGIQHALFKKDDTRYGFSIFRFPVQRYQNEFDVFEIKFPIIPGLQANMNILPVLYFDNETKIVNGNQINTDHYKVGTDFIILTPKNFGNQVHGKSNFFLELRWLGTKLATIGLPAKFTAEVQDD